MKNRHHKKDINGKIEIEISGFRDGKWSSKKLKGKFEIILFTIRYEWCLWGTALKIRIKDRKFTLNAWIASKREWGIKSVPKKL